MGKKDHRRYGSPFDPNFKGTGKTTVPPAAASAPNRKEAARLTEEHKMDHEKMKTVRLTLDSNPFGRSGGLDEMMKAAMHRAFYQGGIISREELTGERETNTSYAFRAARESVKEWLVSADETAFDDIVGNQAALTMLRDAITAPVEHADLYAAYGMKMPKGALLYGPPGCGKTMFARAAATEMRRVYGGGVEFLSIAATELQSGWVGQTEQRIKAIFAFARAYRQHRGHPLLVFIDEADSLLPARDGRRGVHSWEESRVSTFLAEMDGVRESGAFVLLATNRPDAIDQAVLRDGRCDFKIEVKRPDQAAVETLLRRQFSDAPLDARTTLDEIVFAALEGLMDPEKIIAEARMLKIGKKLTLDQVGGRSFLLEHILSGAMVASMKQRAMRHASSRDKATGTFTGISVVDVLHAANDLFVENKGLDHGYALSEFMRETVTMLEESGKLEGRTLQ